MRRAVKGRMGDGWGRGMVPSEAEKVHASALPGVNGERRAGAPQEPSLGAAQSSWWWGFAPGEGRQEHEAGSSSGRPDTGGRGKEGFRNIPQAPRGRAVVVAPVLLH